MYDNQTFCAVVRLKDFITTMSSIKLLPNRCSDDIIIIGAVYLFYELSSAISNKSNA